MDGEKLGRFEGFDRRAVVIKSSLGRGQRLGDRYVQEAVSIFLKMRMPAVFPQGLPAGK